jgi:hypothetical protein
MDNKLNLVSMKFWAKTREVWAGLSPVGKEKWLKLSIELTQNAWAYLASATDLKCPLKYDDFKFTLPPFDVDGDGVLETESTHSALMYYSKLDKACKNTWDATAMKQVLLQLMNQYALRDSGIW